VLLPDGMNLNQELVKQGWCWWYKKYAPGDTVLARTIHEYLLRRPILLPGGAFLVRPPRRTASTPTSASLPRRPGGLRSRTPRDGIHE
jgi:hypothetical protein